MEVESREGREEGEGLGWHGTKGWVMMVSKSGGVERRGRGQRGEEGVGWVGDVDRFL